jgi:hypothetical protein
MKTKLNRIELMRKVNEVVDDATNDPADELIAMGEALVKVGQALKGLTIHDARAVIKGVQAIS